MLNVRNLKLHLKGNLFKMKKLILAICFMGLVLSQVSQGGQPFSFDNSTRSEFALVMTETVDVDRLFWEDEQADKDEPYRFGTSFEVNYNLHNSGTWEDVEGGTLWRLEITSPGALTLNLLYNRFWLPTGGEFFVYNTDQSHVLGAFTSFNNKEDFVFATSPVKGETIILEYFEPTGSQDGSEIQISSIVHGYKDPFGFYEDRNYGDSGSCNNNVNCSAGNDWQDDKRSVAMILTSGNSRICTGALINNVEQDQTQYFLTADHCLGGNNYWIFMFNYESSGCSNSNGPTYQTVQGSTLKASHQTPDFALLKITESIPNSYNVFYAGWSNSSSAPNNSTCIHHPSGDIKKISFDNNPATSSSWQGPFGTHWKISHWEDGTTEPGSSGSPLFDQNHRIVGQLSGGEASCSYNYNDYFGKVAESWDYGNSSSSRLSDWLDPNNTGATTLNGTYDGQILGCTDEEAINYNPNATVDDGSCEYPALIGDLNQDTQINVLDVVVLVNIILGLENPSDYQLVAGDINSDNNINIQDVILTVNLIMQGGN